MSTAPQPRLLLGLVAVVSGSAIGIGRAVSIMAAAGGARVVGLDIDVDGNAETQRRVHEIGGSMEAVRCDVGEADTVAEAIGALDRIDVVVNNAAVWNDTTLTGGDYAKQTAAFSRAMDACAFGSFHLAAAALPKLREAGSRPAGANIVNLITEHIRMHRLITGMPATGYDSAKFVQWRLTESWAKELAPIGIRVNGLAFGATDTPMLRAVSARIAEAGMRAEDIAQAVFNIVHQGPGGATGVTYDVGFSGTPRSESLAQIEAILTR